VVALLVEEGEMHGLVSRALLTTTTTTTTTTTR